MPDVGPPSSTASGYKKPFKRETLSSGFSWVPHALLIHAILVYVSSPPKKVLHFGWEVDVPRVRKGFISPIDEKTIGRNLRELRESQGMTQVELAEQLNIKQALVSAYELGLVRMHGALIAAFAKALGASADDILGIDKRKKGAPTDRRVVRLLHEINALSRRERDALLKTISNYVKGARVA